MSPAAQAPTVFSGRKLAREAPCPRSLEERPRARWLRHASTTSYLRDIRRYEGGLPRPVSRSRRSHHAQVWVPDRLNVGSEDRPANRIRVHARMVIHREQNARVGGVHGDEEWKAIKQVTSASHGRLVGEIEDRILTPTTYSPAPGSMSSGCPNRTNLGPSASPAAISGFPAIADVRPTSCRPIIVAPRLSKLPSSRMAAILKQYLSQAPHEQHGRLLEARVIPRRFSTEQWSRL